MKHGLLGLVCLMVCVAHLTMAHEHMHGATPASNSSSPRKKHAPTSVRVTIDFINDNFPGQMQVYDVKEGSQFDISETRNVKKMSDLPVTKNLNGKFEMKTGDSRTVVLVIENKTDKDMYFNATPHSIMPVESSVAQKFECLCNHSIYKVKKKSFWYRIVRLDLGDDFEGSSIRLTHNIIGVKNEDAKGKYREMLYK